MSGVLCVWANLPDDVVEWYEEEFLPDMREKNSIHTIHCKLTPSGFEGEPIGKLDAPWSLLSVYEVPDIKVATQSCYDMANRPSEEMLTGPLKDARFDTRTYRELKRWESKEWDGDVTQVACIGAMEWRVPDERMDEVFDFYTTCVAPNMIKSPDVLRFRVFEVDNATVLLSDSYETKPKDALHTYFTLVEMETEEWPWDVIVELDTIAKYREYFEDPTVVKWQLSSYLVNRVYTEDDPRGLETKYDPSGEETSSDQE